MCTGTYADANDFGNYFCISVSEDDEASVNRTLRLAASMIHAARQASNQCDCTLADWAADHLMQLNIWIAAAVYNCPCSSLKMTAETKQFYMDQVREDLTLIREGKIELCAGETASEFPVTGWAEQGVNEFARTRIVANDIERNSL